MKIQKVILLLCAWVLWKEVLNTGLLAFTRQPTPPDLSRLYLYYIQGAYDTRKECEEARVKEEQRLREGERELAREREKEAKPPQPLPRPVCFPDTVDPRGRN